MTDMPRRDITGHCEGDCKDRVLGGEKERQKKIAKSRLRAQAPFRLPPVRNSATIHQVGWARTYKAAVFNDR